jgi:hypothetical protein
MIDNAMSLVDVMDGAIAQTADGRIIFFAGDVVVRLVQQFQRTVEAAPAVHVGVDRRMVFEVLSVINRGMLDLADRLIDLVDGVLFFAVHMFSRSHLAQMRARMAQISESMQVSRMPSRFVSESHYGTEGNNRCKYGTMSYSFHSLLRGLSAEMCFVGMNPPSRFSTRQF